MGAAAICAVAGSVQARAQDSIIAYKSMAPELALDLARAALADWNPEGMKPT